MTIEYELYDLSGINELYKRIDRRFTIYKANQLIRLQEPAYLSSIRVYQINPNNSVTELTYPDRWTTNASHEDVTYTAKAKARYFDEEGTPWNVNGTTIVNSFVMTDISVATEYQIAVEYQALFRDLSALDEYDADGPDYSPGLMKSLLEKVEYLVDVKNPVTNITADSLFSIRSLDEDLSGYIVDNYIQGEIHTVNVPNNTFVIRPVNGSFYKHDLVVSYNDTPLVEGTDYLVSGLNHGKTKISQPNSGVYEYIIILSSIAGQVTVDYRAFGGGVSQKDITAIRSVIISLANAITGANDITSSSNLTSVVSSVISRVNYLEEVVRHYQMQTFPYVLNTNGWVDIATIEKNPWSAAADIASTGVGEFRISIENGDYFIDGKMSYNVNVENALSIDVVHTHEPTFEYDGARYFDLRVVPVFRILWNGKPADGLSPNYLNDGIVLQMKILGNSNRSVNVRIHDRTGADSPWTLVDSRGLARTNATTATAYPGTTLRTWASTTATDKSSNEVTLHHRGYTIFAGQIPVSIIEEASYTLANGELPEEGTGIGLTPVIDSTAMELSTVKAIRFKIYDRKTGNYLIEESTQIRITDNTIYAVAMYYISDMCSIECKLSYDETYSLTVRSTSGSNSLLNNRFDLVQIDLIG